MSGKILVVLEQKKDKIKKISNQLLAAASVLNKSLGYDIEALIIGDKIPDTDSITCTDDFNLFVYKNAKLEYYSPSAYLNILREHLATNPAEIILFGNTGTGSDLAPRLAAKLDCGIAPDCTKFEISENNITATRPVYAGKATIDVKIISPIKIFTIRQNIFQPEGENTAKEVKSIEIQNPDLSTKVIEVKSPSGKLSITEADIIVSGGRGLKEPENFTMIEELASLLNGAVGASRAVVDAGWRPHSEQVGQTGKTVSPKLYIAVGISGAIQHLAGMRSSKCIVAINKDKDAPIFQVANYGIAGDLFEVVPEMIKILKQ